MCAPWDVPCIADAIGKTVANTVLGQVAGMLTGAEEWLIGASASWWVLVPSISLYPDRHTTDPNATPIDIITHLHAVILPLTAIVATGGMLWNGLLMALSRKPTPLVNVLRGLWNTALWSMVGVFGTNLLLAGTDALSRYVINSALGSTGGSGLAKRLAAVLVPATGGPLPVGLVILVSGIGTISALIQALLMLFRDGSVLILTAVTPLAAAGGFTTATSGWLRRVVTWQLSLIFYKPVAAMVYASAIWLTGENTATDPRVLLVGVAMMVIALVALPVLMRFFTWTVGSLHSGSGGMGMFATAGAAGIHATASLRGAGGRGVNDHARYIQDTFDGGSPGGPRGGGSGGGGPAPGGPGGGGPGPVPGGGAGGDGPAGGGGAPRFVGATTTPAATSRPASGAGTATAGAGAAAGPAGVVVTGGVSAARAAAQRAGAAAREASADPAGR